MPHTTASSRPSRNGSPAATTATVADTSTPASAARLIVSGTIRPTRASVPAKPTCQLSGICPASRMPVMAPVCQAIQFGFETPQKNPLLPAGLPTVACGKRCGKKAINMSEQK